MVLTTILPIVDPVNVDLATLTLDSSFIEVGDILVPFLALTLTANEVLGLPNDLDGGAANQGSINVTADGGDAVDGAAEGISDGGDAAGA